MASTLAGIAVLLVLGFGHWCIRRHPQWRHNRDARFYITTGYPMVAIAVYLYVDSTDRAHREWLGCLSTLIALTMFIYGFRLLSTPPLRRAGKSLRDTSTRPA